MCIPGVVYTSPEVAAVGQDRRGTEGRRHRLQGGEIPVPRQWPGQGQSSTTDGFVKILADARSDRVLGCHIIGPQAGELIHEVAVIMEFGGSAEDLARTCHAHPTLSEAVKEAALAVANRAIHA